MDRVINHQTLTSALDVLLEEGVDWSDTPCVATRIIDLYQNQLRIDAMNAIEKVEDAIGGLRLGPDTVPIIDELNERLLELRGERGL